MSDSMIRVVLSKLLLLFGSLLLSVLAAEFGARLLLDPVDFLNPTIVTDEVINHRIDGHTGGHDAWGFRNSRVPERADIVCIGDSMTYGVSARMRDSWPAVLGTIRGERVYNMALGGYGPIQYLHLMRTKAVELRPRVVVVGLYFGNDFFDTYNLVRRNKTWSAYGNLSGPDPKESLLITPDYQSGKFLGGVRDWFSRHSVLYSLTTRLPLFDAVRAREMATRFAGSAGDFVVYRDARHNMLFDVSSTSRFLDMNDIRIQTAIEITKRAIIDMQTEARKLGIRLVLLLIPTKERVYARLLKQAGIVNNNTKLANALGQEDTVREVIVSFLNEARIEFVDALPALEEGAVDRDLYPLTDPHPHQAGYRVIAETINRHLSR